MKSCVDCGSEEFPILEIPEEVQLIIQDGYKIGDKKLPLCPTCICQRVKKTNLSGVVCRLP